MSERQTPGIALSRLQSQYETRITQVTPAGTDWIRVLEADPRRLMVRFTSNGVMLGNPAVWPGPHPTFTPGSAGLPLEQEYKTKDCPSWVAGEWYARDNAGVPIYIIECLYVGE